MGKLIVTFGLLLLAFSVHGQKKLLSSKYAGTYSYGNDIEEGAIGSVQVYPETDTTILFFIDLNRGAPSYNMGSLYGEMEIANGTGTFYTKYDYMDSGCKLTFRFSKNNLTIEGNEENGCGFGGGVYADGDYRKKTNKVPNYFQNNEGRKTFFEKTKPKDYYKD